MPRHAFVRCMSSPGKPLSSRAGRERLWLARHGRNVTNMMMLISLSTLGTLTFRENESLIHQALLNSKNPYLIL